MLARYLYKYRELNDQNIQALFGSYVMLSSRKNFEDENDSKISILPLSEKNIRSLRKHAHPKFENWFKRNSLTTTGRNGIAKIELAFEQLIDSYGIYCLASAGNICHMWENYAAEHTGFCIEFHKEPIPAEPVRYKERIGEIEMYPFVKCYLGITKNVPDRFAKRIQRLLYIKLIDFKDENEYRFISTGSLGDELSQPKKYSEDNVSAIIFGSKMKEEDKKFIVNNIPFKNYFKQAIQDEDHGIRIEAFNNV